MTFVGCVDIWDSKVLRSGAGGHFRIPIINSLSWEYLCNYIPDNPAVFIADSRRPSDRVIDDVVQPGSNVDPEDFYSEDDDKFIIEDPETNLTQDQSFAEENVGKYKSVPLNVSLYSEVDYTSQGHTVLIVSGENNSSSTQSRKLAYNYYGQFVMLPMAKGMNTLNPAITGSIILYEIHKQYSDKMGRETDKNEL